MKSIKLELSYYPLAFIQLIHLHHHIVSYEIEKTGSISSLFQDKK